MNRRATPTVTKRRMPDDKEMTHNKGAFTRNLLPANIDCIPICEGPRGLVGEMPLRGARPLSDPFFHGGQIAVAPGTVAQSQRDDSLFERATERFMAGRCAQIRRKRVIACYGHIRSRSTLAVDAARTPAPDSNAAKTHKAKYRPVAGARCS